MNHSASMIKLASRCLRKASFKYASDYPPEPRPEADDSRNVGQELHAAHEDYARKGIVPAEGTDVGDMFRAGLPYVAPPLKGEVEKRKEVNIGGHKYTILMDWYGPSDYLPGAPGGVQAILDHKTSSAPQKYGVGFVVPPIEDVQVVLYSAFALIDSRQDQVFGRWLYYPTKVKRKKALPQDFILGKGEVEDAFGRLIYPVSGLLKKIKNELPDPNTVAPNALACNDFGRVCWYAQENGGPCRLTDQDYRDAIAREIGESIDMGLRDVAAKAKAQASPPPPEDRVDPQINPPDKVEELPPELEPEEKPKASKPAATKTRKTKAPVQGSQAEDIGKGVLAVLDAIKERWG